jgi:5-methylcytosine-specific restriction protein A
LISSALIDSAVSQAADFLGLQLFRENDSGEDFDFSVRLVALPSPKGFRVRVADNYMAWDAQVVLDDLSLRLVQVMGDRAKLRELEFLGAIDSIRKSSQKCEVLLNGLPLENEVLTSTWSDFEAKITVGFAVESRLEKLVDTLIFAISIPLVLLQEDLPPELLPLENSREVLEGEKSTVLQNKYERSRFNRAMCLRAHGFNCMACGDKLSNKYGVVAQELVHVHHITPVSTLGGATVVDPIRDLVPLCPNCHNVIHRRNPPFSIEELKAIISQAPKSTSE